MDQANYSEQLQSIYRNMLFQRQSFAYANMMAAISVPPPQIKIEPVVPLEVPHTPIASLSITPHSIKTSSLSPCSISLDTEIPRDEIEGDIEVIMVRNFLDILKKLDTSMNGLRGKKFGYREVLEMTQTRPTYANLNSSVKRNRTSSFGSISSTVPSTHDEEDRAPKKVKLEASHNTSCSSDDGRLLIDWEDEEAAAEKPPKKTEKAVQQPAAKIDSKDDDYKPFKLRFERLKQIQKKKPRFNIDNLDLTYHSNMARHFPGTENRSEEQQNRRDKNTLAARISRNKNKAYEKYLEQQSIDSTVENINLKRQVACLRVYANSLMKMSGFADTDFSKMFEANIKDMTDQQDE